MPEDVFSADVERSLNAISDSSFLQNKNIYHRWFTAGKFPRSYFHKIYGCFYDDQFNRIRSIDQFLTNSEIPPQGVLKVSHDSSGGIGVYFVSSIKELAEQLDGPMNLVFQERIIQDESLDRIYRKSLNTVRACLYRSVRDDSIHVLNMSLRMGKGGSLDNETAGGIVCSINDGGSLNEFSVDKHGIKYFEHPDTQFIFKGASVPDYEAARSVAIDVFAQMPHSRLASLDLCYDESGSWRVIEINLVDQTIRFAQYAGKPFFGEFTDEVQEWVQKNHWALKR